jgi:hypothetical protein
MKKNILLIFALCGLFLGKTMAQNTPKSVSIRELMQENNTVFQKMQKQITIQNPYSMSIDSTNQNRNLLFMPPRDITQKKNLLYVPDRDGKPQVKLLAAQDEGLMFSTLQMSNVYKLLLIRIDG